uniref:Uncharacterized protein n=1 Tax=Arundo donax TaxID=35708 RepID=A0A0A9FGE2_ARUDO
MQTTFSEIKYPLQSLIIIHKFYANIEEFYSA